VQHLRRLLQLPAAVMQPELLSEAEAHALLCCCTQAYRAS
jgi:hypothetical protein